MKFRDYFSLKHILFGVLLIALMMVFAYCQAGSTVDVYFADTNVQVTSDKYSMTIHYEDIVSVTLEDLADAGTELADTYDNDILRAGKWENDAWGEHHICAYLGTTKCVVVKVSDGRTLVFSKKSDAKTTELYEQLLTYLP